MRAFQEIVMEHCSRYPDLEVQDLVKLCYQSALGSGHMLPDYDTVVSRLKTEIECITPNDKVALFEEIGGGLSRINLARIDCCGLCIETVAGMFRAAASDKEAPKLSENLNTLRTLASCGKLPFSEEYIEKKLSEYESSGCPAVHHSDKYRECYSPAYRLVPGSVEKYLSAFTAIDKLLHDKTNICIAIDGMCAAGKSTLGELLKRVYDANLFHMDDFFLPLNKKTAARLSQPGGNIDYERFYEDVLRNISKGAFLYRPFDCSTQLLSNAIDIIPKRVSIVEGAYSAHPALRSKYDLIIGLRVKPEIQKERIIHRNGLEMYRSFKEEWIPLENKYIEAESIWSVCDLVFE